MGKNSNNTSAAIGYSDTKVVKYSDLTDASTTQTLTYAVNPGEMISAVGTPPI